MSGSSKLWVTNHQHVWVTKIVMWGLCFWELSGAELLSSHSTSDYINEYISNHKHNVEHKNVDLRCIVIRIEFELKPIESNEFFELNRMNQSK